MIHHVQFSMGATLVFNYLEYRKGLWEKEEPVLDVKCMFYFS
jgi:hypothetical protein